MCYKCIIISSCLANGSSGSWSPEVAAAAAADDNDDDDDDGTAAGDGTAAAAAAVAVVAPTGVWRPSRPPRPSVYSAPWRVWPGGRTARTVSRTGCIRTAWRLSATDNAETARPTGRTATCIPATCNHTVSRPNACACEPESKTVYDIYENQKKTNIREYIIVLRIVIIALNSLLYNGGGWAKLYGR